MILARQFMKPSELKEQRIGLALSGGGFRAAIFHLGVIRRLEELGIMQKVDVISAVSGGSIIAAYYVCEMERRLRLVPVEERTKREVRIRLFEEVAENFFNALDHNLRSRALIFTPFYHPWLFIKTLIKKLFRSTARSELIQREYDKWFYDGNTLDQLPSTASGKKQPETGNILGPRVLLNTTSLLSGERVTFSREPVSGVNEMSKVNKNVIPLSRVVGASSGVPGLFPPTAIAGDMLVDGGVADNQGIESLIDDPVRCNILLVSDASGQMEQLDSIGRSVMTVVSRVNSVLQFQVRNKLIDILVAWKNLPNEEREDRRFGFVHLFLNLKDRPNVPYRVPSEFIAAIGRIRTDLDQFSYIEREALMYHGYTLIDAQMRMYCQDKLSEFLIPMPAATTMCTPPLFQDAVLNTEKSREEILGDLRAGSQNVYLLRCANKHPETVIPILATWAVAALALLWRILFVTPQILSWLRSTASDVIHGVIPNAVVAPLDTVLKRLGLIDLSTSISGLSGIAALLILALLALYVVSYPAYWLVRRLAVIRDRKVYETIAGEEPSAHWTSKEQGVVRQKA